MAPKSGLGRLSRKCLTLMTLLATARVGEAFTENEYCGVALMQGYREAMEDKALCLESIHIDLCPFDKSRDSERVAYKSEGLEVRAFVMFDGHNGGEASEYAAVHIQEILIHHLRSIFSEGDLENCKEKSALLAKSGVRKLLQKVSEALERTLLQLDADFLAEAESRGVMAGTTACVALLVEDTWLQVANIGDSRATLRSAAPASGCPSQCIPSSRHGKHRKKSRLCALELTRDHRFDRADEIERVEKAGGIVLNIGGVKRLMGVSMPSRAIGDADLKPYGMIADPELSDWIHVSESDGQYLVVASDGLYEDIPGGQCVCDLIEGVGNEKGGQKRQPPIPLGPSFSVQGGGYSEQANDDLLSESEQREDQTLGERNLQDEELLPSREMERSRKEGTCSFVESSHNGGEGVETECSGYRDEQKTSDLSKGKVQKSSGTGKASPEKESGSQESATSSSTPSPNRNTLLPGQIAETLRDAAFIKGSMDNIAVVVADLKALRASREHNRTRPANGKDNLEESLIDKARESVAGDRDTKRSKSLQLKLGDEEQPGALQVSESEPFKVYISGQVVYGEGSEWCYQLLEFVSGLRALPAPNPVIPTSPLPTELQNALPDSPSAWGTTLELYHRHLIATVDLQSEGSGGLAAILDAVASGPIQPGSPADLQPGWEAPRGEATGEEVWMPAGVQREEGDHRYRYLLHDNFAKGAFGEVWRAVRMPDEADTTGRRCRSSCVRVQPDLEIAEQEEGRGDAGTPFILKRLLVEKGGEVRLSGLRKKYFGELLMNASATWQQEQATAHANTQKGSGRDSNVGEGYAHIVRYMDSFEMHSGRELWLVFRDEGKSLQDWMYDSPISMTQKGLGVVSPSAWWRWLRTDARGRQEMKSIMWQLLAAIHTCHQHDITHRDLKQANLALMTRPAHSTLDASDWQQASNLSLRLIDFGSAWSPAVHHLYGNAGPSKLQETPEYSPPEALFAQDPWLPRRPEKATKYDMWSVGVLFLELLLGTPHVFQISARTRVLLDRQLAACPDATCKELAYTLRGFLELCIYPPAPLPPLTPKEEGLTEEEKTNPAKQGDKADKTSLSSTGSYNEVTSSLRLKVSSLGSSFVSSWSTNIKPLLKELTEKVFKRLVSANPEAAGSKTRSERSKSGALAWQCSEDSFLNQIKTRDPLRGEAEIDVWALRLIRRLLQWNPEERISAREAMEHAYFRKGMSGGFKCGVCDKEFESHAQCTAHSAAFHHGETTTEGHCE